MQILLKTDNHIEGNAKLTGYVEGLVNDSLERFTSRVTSVHVHLTDENRRKSRGATTSAV